MCPLCHFCGHAVIPTLYAGTTFDGVLMETVFHDVPYQPSIKTVSKAKYVESEGLLNVRKGGV